MQQPKPTDTHERSGWNGEEQALLLEKVRQTREKGKPLKAAFDEMAKVTGRKPNSIRNFYYAKIKEGAFEPASERGAFTPFTGDEMETLLEEVLRAQANGISVRGITMRLGNGDRKTMLRFQNKYRSLLRNNPETVKAAVERLKERGESWYDPYTHPRVHKAGRKPGSKRKPELKDLLEQLGDTLRDNPQVDAQALISQLLTLSQLAAQSSAQGQTS